MKLFILQKAFDRVMESKWKCPQHSSQKLEKKTKIHMKMEKKLWRVKTILNKAKQIKTNKQRKLILGYQSRIPDVLLSYSTKNSLIMAQNRHIDRWNKTEDPNMWTRNFGDLVFYRGQKHTLKKRLQVLEILRMLDSQI